MSSPIFPSSYGYNSYKIGNSRLEAPEEILRERVRIEILESREIKGGVSPEEVSLCVSCNGGDRSDKLIKDYILQSLKN